MKAAVVKSRLQVDPSARVHPSVVIEGDVSIGANCRVSAGTIINGSLQRVCIGANTTIGANAVVESTYSANVEIGEWVTILPGTVVQGATVGDWSVIGHKCVLEDCSSLGTWSFLADGSVLPPRQQVPDGYLSAGIPARRIGEQGNEDVLAHWRERKIQLVGAE